MLTARTEALDYVEADEASRGGDFFCRDCGSPVALKHGAIRIAHFAHRPQARCALGARMSLEHLTAQRRLADALRGRGAQVQLEAPARSLAGDRRIDVLAWPADRPRMRIAIEVQASDLTAELVAARTASYAALGVAPLWLRLLGFGRFERVQTLPLRGAIWIEAYRARAWERWAHDALGGRLWFLDSGTWLAWRGTFLPAFSYSEAAGGSWREIARWVDLELEGPFALDGLRLNRGRVIGRDGEKRLAAWLVPPGELGAAPSEPSVRTQVRQEGASETRELQVRVDGRWTPAAVDGARSDWRTAPPVRASVALGTTPDRGRSPNGASLGAGKRHLEEQQR